jgi:hypothetical protein
MWGNKKMGSVASVIQGLNQRGGRMLTAADLLAASTVDVELMAYLMWSMRRGASLIVCAGPGGTGKTTLLGALLCFLPADVELRVVQGCHQYHDTGVCYLCHELGSGYFSYLWGAEARALLETAKHQDRRYCATTAHADSLDELRELIVDSEIALSAEALAHIDLVVFMGRMGRRALRRVTHVYVGTGDPRRSHTHVCQWDAQTDRFVWRLPRGEGWDATSPLHGELGAYRAFLGDLCQQQILQVADVRRAVLDFYRHAK